MYVEEASGGAVAEEAGKRQSGTVKVKPTQPCPTPATPWTVARQAPPSMEFCPGKSAGVGCHFLLQGKGPSSMLGCLSCFLRAMREAVAFFTHWPNLGFRKTKGAQDWRA